MVDRFSEKVEVLDNNGDPTVELDGHRAEISVGGNGQHGKVLVCNETGLESCKLYRTGNLARLNMGANGNDGQICVKNALGEPVIVIDGRIGAIFTRKKFDNELRPTIYFSAKHASLNLGSAGNPGKFSITNKNGDQVILVQGNNCRLGSAGNPGKFSITNKNGKQVFIVQGNNFKIRNDDGEAIFKVEGNTISIGRKNNTKFSVYAGDKVFGVQRDHMKARAIEIGPMVQTSVNTGRRGDFGEIVVRDDSGNKALYFTRGALQYIEKVALGKSYVGDDIELFIGTHNWPGSVFIKDEKSWPRIWLCGRYGAITLYNSIGQVTFSLDSYDATLKICDKIHMDGRRGDITLQAADCAEEFDVSESEKIGPGTVLIIGNDERLYPCKTPYDKKVAGVVSGGDGSNPGIILDKNPGQNKRLPVALNGKVYCNVDAQYSPIEVGDMLTTSSTIGHAMKADDPLKAFGAVIGKALRPLKKGQGLIPILVALQ